MAVDLADFILRGVRADVRAVLEKSLEGRELDVHDAMVLLSTRGRDLQALCMVGDIARAEDVGDEISYVICRNINLTNVCYVGCSFCGFARHKHEPDAYDRGFDDLLERAHDAWKRGASEVCIQGGIHPNKDGFYYRDMLAALAGELPDMHVHAFSPEEIHFGVGKSDGMALADYLTMLKEAGLGTMPGTAAEILDDEIRTILSPRKLMTERWIEIIKTAHEVGLRTTSTLMYGHIEEDHHIARHFEILRDIQKETGGFTEFVALGFIHHNTRLYNEQGSRPGATMPEDLRILAIARLFLRPHILNIQVSWVKMGFKTAQQGLCSGANDFGGTLMEESISRAAGSEHGDAVEADKLEQLIREIDRVPYERTTTYERAKRRSPAASPLELVTAATTPAEAPLQSGY